MQPPDWDQLASDAEGRPGRIIADLEARRDDVSVLVVAYLNIADDTWFFDYAGNDVTVLGMIDVVAHMIRHRIARRTDDADDA